MPTYLSALGLMLTSLQNSLVKQMRKLQHPKERREQQMFLLEGTHLLEEALTVGYPLVTVCCTPQWIERYSQLWDRVNDCGSRVEVVSEEVIKAIASTVNPDGVVATATRQKLAQPSLSTDGVQLALETLQDPGNLGTIIRTSVAAAATGLWLSEDSVDLDNLKVLRASAGQWFRLPMAVRPDLKGLVQEAQSQGIQVVGTSMTASLTYWEVDFQKPTLILLGNEGAGLSDDLAAAADVQVKIPLDRGVESLNVAIASALLLYEAQRQRIRAGMPPS